MKDSKNLSNPRLFVKGWSANARDVLRKITRVTAAFTRYLGKATGEYASWITWHITVAAKEKFHGRHDLSNSAVVTMPQVKSARNCGCTRSEGFSFFLFCFV